MAERQRFYNKLDEINTAQTFSIKIKVQAVKMNRGMEC